MGYRTAFLALGVLVLAITGCAQRSASAKWQAVLPWGAAVHAEEVSGRTFGPSAFALTDNTIVIADSFARHLLVWRRSAGSWIGPRVIGLPSTVSIVTAVAVTADGTIVAADDRLELWSFATLGQATVMGSLARAGQFVSVTSLVPYATGALADVLQVGPAETVRALYALPIGGPPYVVKRTIIATPGEPARHPAGPPWLLLPAGVERGLAPAGNEDAWVLGRTARGQPALIRMAAPETIGHPIPVPACVRCDFLGVARGLIVFLSMPSTPEAAVEAFERHGRIAWRLPLPDSQGPQLGAYAVMAANGALLTMTSTPTALTLRWYAPGVAQPAGRQRGNRASR